MVSLANGDFVPLKMFVLWGYLPSKEQVPSSDLTSKSSFTPEKKALAVQQSS